MTEDVIQRDVLKDAAGVTAGLGLAGKIKATQRVLHVGSQTTSAQQWWRAKKAIADGAIGEMILNQRSYHRNSTEGEWNYRLDPDTGPDKKGEDFIDWQAWLGSRSRRGTWKSGTSRTSWSVCAFASSPGLTFRPPPAPRC